MFPEYACFAYALHICINIGALAMRYVKWEYARRMMKTILRGLSLLWPLRGCIAQNFNCSGCVQC